MYRALWKFVIYPAFAVFCCFMLLPYGVLVALSKLFPWNPILFRQVVRFDGFMNKLCERVELVNPNTTYKGN